MTGVVRSIAPFGVFIDLGGIDGLVHKSELSWNKVNNPETAYAIGEEVEAEVIDINHERGRISLSIRRLQPDPWQEAVAKYKIGDVIEGTVTKLVNFGAFVRVEEGLEGLIHISELSNQRVAHPGDVVKEGEVLKLKIISLDSERHRLGLSLKQAEDRRSGRRDAGRAGPAGRFEDRPPRRDRGRDRVIATTARRTPSASRTRGSTTRMAAAFASSGLLDQFRSRAARRRRRRSRSDRAPRQPPRRPRPRSAAEARPPPRSRWRSRWTPAAEAAEAPDAEAEPVEATGQPRPKPPQPKPRQTAAEASRQPKPIAEAEADATPKPAAEAEPEAEPTEAAEPRAEPEAEPEAEAEAAGGGRQGLIHRPR